MTIKWIKIFQNSGVSWVKSSFFFALTFHLDPSLVCGSFHFDRCVIVTTLLWGHSRHCNLITACRPSVIELHALNPRTIPTPSLWMYPFNPPSTPLLNMTDPVFLLVYAKQHLRERKRLSLVCGTKGPRCGSCVRHNQTCHMQSIVDFLTLYSVYHVS